MSIHQRFPWRTGLLLVSLGTSTLAAQEGRPVPIEATASQAGNFEQRLDALREEFKEAERAYRDGVRKSKTPEERMVAFQVDPWEAIGPRVGALALESEGSEHADGVWALLFTGEVGYGSTDRALEAFQVLTHDHPESEELVAVVRRAQSAGLEREATLEGLSYLVEVSEERSIRGASLFTLAKLLEEKEQTRAQALGHYRAIVADYADLDSGIGATLGDKATASIFETERLQIGMQVPDIASVDETSAPFNLSDYAGKVVLVDFWGFW